MLAKPPGRPAVQSAARTAPGSVRIIAGSLRGSKLPVLDHPGLRPTPDRVRETLFNWLRPILPGARVLDLFAGTGALGIEAMSQGAGSVWLVEAEARLARHLEAQVTRLKLDSSVEVHSARALDLLKRMEQPFDLILLDPPYALNLWPECLATIQSRGLLKPHGLIYLEWPRAQAEPVCPGYEWFKRGQAGQVEFGLLRAG